MKIKDILAKLSLEEKAALLSGRDFWHTRAVEHTGIPSVMMCDGPHGLRKQKDVGDHLGLGESVKAVCFPTAAALASSFDRELLESLGETLGEACLAEDVGMLLGPGLNIKRSPLCGRNFEYFSEDPYLTGEMGAAFIKGLQSKGVAASPKHYAANNQETRRMSTDSQLDERTLHEIYLPGFEAAVKQGKTRGIMCSYNKLNGTYLAEHQGMLNDILRGKWGFDGCVVTDWGAVKDRVQGLLAGLDLEMPGPGSQTAKIVQAVQNGDLDESILDEAVCNVLKIAMDYRQSKLPGTAYDIRAQQEKAADIAGECAVLLKNEDKLLPLDKGKRVAFIGAFAGNPRYQGAGSSHINSVQVVSALEAVQGLAVEYAEGYRLDGVPDGALLDEAVDVARRAEAAVLFIGLPDAYESEGFDRDNMVMPDNQNTLIKAITAVQPHTVAVFHGGAPVEMPWVDDVKAILSMYLGGEQVGTATARILFGDVNPCGKLAETWPLKLSDNPSYLSFPDENNIVEYREGVFVGYRYYDTKEMNVCYPFGHGLSYTDFEYSAMSLDKTAMKDSDSLGVSVTVKNSGTRSGKEVVQLYVRQEKSAVRRPLRELKEFGKVELAPGEAKTLSFKLGKRAFSYYEPRIDDWYAENGAYYIEAGTSSRDIRLCERIDLEATSELPFTYTKHSTMYDMMKTAKGRVLVELMQEQVKANVPLDDPQVLGEAAVRMMQEMALNMPLSAMVGYGRMSEDELDGMVARLNSE